MLIFYQKINFFTRRTRFKISKLFDTLKHVRNTKDDECIWFPLEFNAMNLSRRTYITQVGTKLYRLFHFRVATMSCWNIVFLVLKSDVIPGKVLESFFFSFIFSICIFAFKKLFSTPWKFIKKATYRKLKNVLNIFSVSPFY